ncbi:MAG: WG repeat-containing protein [Oscillospiraceae bacterium]
MKKLIPLILVLCLLLSGCGLVDQARTVQEKYIAPAIEKAKTGVSSGDAAAAGPRVKTNGSQLLAYEPLNAPARLSPSALTEFKPAPGYGLVLPYIVGGTSGGEGGGFYGLASSDGRVLLDPVLTACAQAALSDRLLKIYIAEKTLTTADASPAPRYALIALDGTWATDFLYTAVYPNELGCICVTDSEKNLAVCYAEDGSVVFDTSKFSTLGSLAPDSLDSLAVCSSGLMSIRYTNGKSGFMDKTGAILNKYADLASYFDDARPFSEGLAAVKLNGTWNYIDTNGKFAVYGLFAEAGNFESGIALVKKDGSWLAINVEGDTVRDFGAVADDSISREFGCVALRRGEVTEYYLAPSMDKANLYDKELFISPAGYWVVGDTGVRLRLFGGGEVYFSGAVELLDAREGLYLTRLADGDFAVMDANGQVVAVSERELSFVSDSVTGELYLRDGALAYTASGVLVAEDALPAAPVSGFFLRADGLCSGFSDSPSHWLLRLPLDAAD